MKKLIKNIIKDILPPFFYRTILDFTAQLTFSGSYSSWQEAQALSKGYNDSAIIDKVLTAALSVKNGKAAYERDSVLFNKIEYSWPLLTGLMLAASYRKKDFSVLDFGGAFGSSYFQNKKFIDAIGNVKWHIVEQTEFVRRGKENMENEYLLFHESIVSALASAGCFDAALLSSVLQYLETPYETLEQIISMDLPYIIIDRTPLYKGLNDRLTVQKVHPSIYDASYPAWILSENKMLKCISDQYNIISQFVSLGGNIRLVKPDGMATYTGFILKRKKN
ncbi:MAG: hypothetical protein UT30_C0017G0023 [Candidatus Uhrbacteria bacterium GW2011_GWF2_39_13]|uniref:Methyltransferase, TIGR04325 family n=1 Tax=Candidatus Uhrbacteria bacterium GW2011_GWF2_39_13 TaxID=1618995 RepID=A0A0G0MIK7_9BACT|nr:MAG: hypothetical protein UT30_C0017G0023 [Candidatus Uhrbacteria bacterium GW2011_GWF2_39_13]